MFFKTIKIIVISKIKPSVQSILFVPLCEILIPPNPAGRSRPSRRVLRDPVPLPTSSTSTCCTRKAKLYFYMSIIIFLDVNNVVIRVA